MGVVIDVTGQRFGRLIVLGKADPNLKKSKNKSPLYECKCDCGKRVFAYGNYLRAGRTKSCGCLQRDFAKQQGTHYQSKTPLYSCWRHIKQRCTKTNCDSYKNYGGRGITMCDEWLNSFENFRDWALANGYSEKLTIDRIDNNGNYEPSNCRWTTRKEQQNNRRAVRLIEYNGRTMTASQWSEYFGMPYTSFLWRINHGWTMERIDATPTRRGRNGYNSP